METGWNRELVCICLIVVRFVEEIVVAYEGRLSHEQNRSSIGDL